MRLRDRIYIKSGWGGVVASELDNLLAAIYFCTQSEMKYPQAFFAAHALFERIGQSYSSFSSSSSTSSPSTLFHLYKAQLRTKLNIILLRQNVERSSCQ